MLHLYFNSSSAVTPFLLAFSSDMAQQLPVFSRSSTIMKYQGWRSNFNPIQLSAPNRWENIFSCSTSSLSKYFLLPLVALHSIATRLIAFPAKMSGEGYFDEPLPATRMQLHPASLNRWTSSRSALIPLALTFIMN